MRKSALFSLLCMGASRNSASFYPSIKDEESGVSFFFVCTCGDDTGRTAQVFSSAVRRKGWHCVAGYSVTMPNTYVSLPGFDVDAEDVEEQKVQNAMARLDFINGELAGRIHMKHFNCHEGALPFTKTYLLRPLFNTF